MSFKPHKTTFLSLWQHRNRALIPLSDKDEFQLASISASSGMPSAKLLSAVSVKLSIPAMFRDERRWQLSASVLIVHLEAAHWRKPRCWIERQAFTVIDIPRSVTSSHQDISKTFNWSEENKCRENCWYRTLSSQCPIFIVGKESNKVAGEQYTFQWFWAGYQTLSSRGNSQPLVTRLTAPVCLAISYLCSTAFCYALKCTVSDGCLSQRQWLKMIASCQRHEAMVSCIAHALEVKTVQLGAVYWNRAQGKVAKLFTVNLIKILISQVSEHHIGLKLAATAKI